MRISGGPTVELTNTNFLIVSDHEEISFVSGYKGKAMQDLQTIGLKVKRISNSRKNAIKIEAFLPNLEKIRAHPNLLAASLSV